jgi:uncharacterized protein YigA (DUF484 family)
MDQAIKDINKRLDKLTPFIEQNMLTKQELDDLRSDLPTRADFANLLSSVDGIAKRFSNQGDEMLIIGERTSRMEKWIQQEAKKIGFFCGTADPTHPIAP